MWRQGFLEGEEGRWGHVTYDMKAHLMVDKRFYDWCKNGYVGENVGSHSIACYSSYRRRSGICWGGGVIKFPLSICGKSGATNQ